MQNGITIDDLRMHLEVRLAVAPRHLLKTLWQPKGLPHERDEATRHLVEFITHGWDSLNIEITGPVVHRHSVPATQAEGSVARAPKA